MPTYFVTLIELYRVGFDKLDDLPSEEFDMFMKLREGEIEEIMSLQFMLAYLGNISKADSDNMTPFELRNWFNLLKKQKELEAERNSGEG